MSAPIIGWEKVTRRRDAVLLQSFSCTTPMPKSPGGRKLPHPKPWEYEVQSHFRECSKRLKNGDLLVIGRRVSDGEVVAAVHLLLDGSDPEVFAAHIAAIAVGSSVRGCGGVVADSTLAQARNCILEGAHFRGVDCAVATASIHRRNHRSEALFERAGFEPMSVPVGEYQRWACRLL